MHRSIRPKSRAEWQFAPLANHPTFVILNKAKDLLLAAGGCHHDPYAKGFQNLLRDLKAEGSKAA